MAESPCYAPRRVREDPVEFLGGKRMFQPVNMLEEKSGQGEEQTLKVKPYEIGTVQIRVN